MENYKTMDNIFNHLTTNEKTRNEFNKFIFNNVKQFFSSAESDRITFNIPDIRAKSVINGRGKDRDTLMKLANTFDKKNSNNARLKTTHQQFIFKTILLESGGDWNKLIKLIRDYLSLLEVEEFRWNIVKYGYYDEMAVKVL